MNNINLTDNEIMGDLEQVIDEIRETVAKYSDLYLKYGKFRSVNLKLYNVNSYLYELVEKGVMTEDETVEVFNLYCGNEYEYFTEVLKSEGLKERYIGRSSNFYIVSSNYSDALNVFYNQHDSYIFEFIEDVEAVKIGHITFNIDEIEALYKGNVKTVSDFYNIHDTIYKDINEFREDAPLVIDSIRDQINLLNSEIKNIAVVLNNIKKAYEGIENYMDNQVENFKLYLSEYKEAL